MEKNPLQMEKRDQEGSTRWQEKQTFDQYTSLTYQRVLNDDKKFLSLTK